MTLKVSNMTYRGKPRSYSFINEKNGNTSKSIDILNAVQISRKKNIWIMAKL